MIWLKKLLIPFVVLTSCVLLLTVAEYILQEGFGLGEPIVYDAHPLWGYAPRPDSVYLQNAANVVSINNVGVRSISDWVAEENNILFLGDSVTYGGRYINDDQTFASLACADLSNWSCHNAGVNAYGILNMVARSRYDERIKSASITIFTFISGDFDRGLQKESMAHFILREPPGFFPALWEVGNYFAARVVPKDWFGKNSKNNLSDEVRAERRYVNQKFALDVFITELERLKSLKKDFILIHSPIVAEMVDTNLIKENKILSSLQEMYPDNIVMLDSILREPFQSNHPDLYVDVMHYGQEGHRIVGYALGEILKEKVPNWNSD